MSIIHINCFDDQNLIKIIKHNIHYDLRKKQNP